MTETTRPAERPTFGSGFRRQIQRLWRAIGLAIAGRTAASPRGITLEAPSHLAMLEDAMQSLGDGVALYGPDDRLVWFNRRFRELRSVNPLSCRIGAHFADILRSAVTSGEVQPVPEDLDVWLQARVAERRQGIGSKVMFRNGRWLRVTDRVTPDGSVISIHSDVTELKAAEAASEAARARLERQAKVLSTLIENVDVGVSLVDADGRFMAFNDAYRKLYDLPPELYRIGASFESHIRLLAERGDFGDGVDVEAIVHELVERAMRPVAQQFERTRRSGRVLQFHRTPLPGGGFVTTHIDVTEVRHREGEIAEARAQVERHTATLAMLIDNARVGITLVGADGRYLAVNAAFHQIYELPPDVAKPGDTFESFIRYLAEHGDYVDGQDVETTVAREFAAATSGEVQQYERTRRNGRTVQIHRAPLPGGGLVTTYIDVTEARHREVDLKEARTRLERQTEVLSTLIENAQAGIALTDAEGRFIAFNRAYFELYDIPRNALKPGDTYESFIRYLAEHGDFAEGDDPAAAVRRFLDCTRRGMPDKLERTRRNGEVLQIRRAPLPGGGLVTTYIDVTEARRREVDLNETRSRLERQTELLSLLIENQQAGVCLVGADGRFAALNRAYGELWGLPAEICKVGGTFEAVMRFLAERGDFGEVQDAAKYAAQRAADAMISRPDAHERTRPNGRVVQVRSVPLPGGGFVGTFIDVTEARRREVDLNEARTRLERQTEVLSTLIENLQAGVTLVDANGRFMALNQAYLDLYDIPHGTFKPGDTYESCIRYMVEHGDFADGGENTEATVRRIVDRAMRAEPQQFERTRANGSVVEIRRVPLPSGGFVTTYFDVTEARRREVDLKEARVRLERQAAELAATAHGLQAANAAKSTFLANMSHELRTPLNAILGFAEVMRDAMLGPLDARYRAYAKDIHGSGAYLLRLINDILDISKIDAGQMRLEREPIDLVELIAECERLVLERARSASVAVTCAIGPQFPAIAGDRLRLKQVLLNLLVNAIKFTPSGGSVRLSAAASARDGIDIAITDTGIGMEPKHIARALEPFQQLDNRLARRYEGTGLGLPLAKSLIELHGGKLTLDSAPGKGTTARIWLPSERLIDGCPPAAASGLRVRH